MTYNLKSIFQFLLNQEIEGERFFKDVAIRFNNVEITDMFYSISEEEHRHVKQINGMLIFIKEQKAKVKKTRKKKRIVAKIKGWKDAIRVNYHDLESEIKSLAPVFIQIEDELSPCDIVNIDDQVSVINYCFSMKRLNVAFYENVASVFPGETGLILLRILRDENKHLNMMSALRRKFRNPGRASSRTS